MKLEFSMEPNKSSVGAKTSSTTGAGAGSCPNGNGSTVCNNGTPTSGPLAGIKAQENCYVTQTTVGNLESLPCYYGLISREDAEWVLHDLGCTDGLYLLRESGPDYVLSLCCHNSVLHYRINRLPSGDVSLQGLPNQQFPSPMQLIDQVDGLACRPTTPARSSVGKCLPPTHWGLSGALVRAELITRAHNFGLSSEYLSEHLDCDCHFSSTFSPLVVSLIYKSLHEIQPWYHFRLSRADAERRLEAAGHYDGRFLVRERDASSYAICLSHESRIKHYRIDILPSGMFAIQDGPKFDSIISLISHYTLFAGGLWCMLTEPCSRPQDLVRQYAEQSSQALQLTRENLLAFHHHHHSHLGHTPSYQDQHQNTLPHHHHHHHYTSHHHHQHPHLTNRPYGHNCHNFYHLNNGSPISVRSWINSCENSPRSKSHERPCCLGDSGLVRTNSSSKHPCRYCGHQRPRRVSNPTNLKLKEWFTTINHKWARIKRQVILHHQRQQPLINEEYGSVINGNDEQMQVTCCSAGTTTANRKKPLKNGNFSLCGSKNRTEWIDRYAIYGYTSRQRHQFGRWNEEPTFGSRYAFTDNNNNNNDDTMKNRFKDDFVDSGFGKNSAAIKNDQSCGDNGSNNNNKNESSNDNDNNNHHNQANLNANKANDRNGAFQDGNDSNLMLSKIEKRINLKNSSVPALIKSSSIDTIVGLINDPIEEIRRLHLCEHSEQVERNTLENGTGYGLNSLPVRYSELFDPGDEICSKNLCNCGDWLLDFDNGCSVLDPFDIPQALDGSGRPLDLQPDDEQMEFTKENCFQVPYAKSNALELAELFSSQALLTPLWNPTQQELDDHHQKAHNLTTNTSDSGASSSGEGHGDPESGLGQTTSAPISSVSGSGGSGSSSVSSSTGSGGKQNECCKQEPDTWRCVADKGMNGAITDLLKEFDVCFNSNPDKQTTNTPQGLPKISQSGIPAPSIPPPRPPNFALAPEELEVFESLNDLIDSKSSDTVKLNQASEDKNAAIDDDEPWPEAPTEAETNGQACNGQSMNQNDIELICLNEQAEEVQETIRRCQRGPICFDPRCITLKRKIGNGYFGDVHLATIPCSKASGSQINLAVKMLKSSAVPQQKAEILREAQTMAKLDHRHIVRIIGVCEGDPFMLVMELAPLGPLNKYLQNYGKQTMTESDILKLMHQVAKAMKYLEDMNFVHRDLAARNILLVNEQFVKVSDFGMSRALGEGKDYYKARSASKWPLKWYAPECIYYYKFSSRSDVWSYGVALWEAMSRGEMPYAGLDGQDILKMFAENRRLSKPDKCPVVIYQLMWSCWQFKPEERPSFDTICDKLRNYLETQAV